MMQQLAAFDLMIEDVLLIEAMDRRPQTQAHDAERVRAPSTADSGTRPLQIPVDDHCGLAILTVWLSPLHSGHHYQITLGSDGLRITTDVGHEYPIQAPAGRYHLDVEQRHDGQDRLHIRIVLHPGP